jgi:hypothetical protein
MICSRMKCITKENTIDRPSLELVQLLPFLKDKALATRDMEVTHLGCVTVHQLVIGFLLVHSEIHHVRNIPRGIDRLSENLLGVLYSQTREHSGTPKLKSPGIESPPKPTKNLGPNRNPSIGGRTRSLRDQDQAQRCTRQLSMIPTNRFEPKHLRIKGTSRARKTDENNSKKT